MVNTSTTRGRIAAGSVAGSSIAITKPVRRSGSTRNRMNWR
jgi:hypothetical protein